MGGYSEGEPPVPIPNTEVKPFSADGTAYSGRVGRRPPSEPRFLFGAGVLCLCVLILVYRVYSAIFLFKTVFEIYSVYSRPKEVLNSDFPTTFVPLKSFQNEENPHHNAQPDCQHAANGKHWRSQP